MGFEIKTSTVFKEK